MDFFLTVRHLRRYTCDEVSPFGGVTILAAVNLAEGSRTIHYTIAFCSEKDLFSKEYGRNLAFERMLDNANVYECEYTNYEDGGSILDHILEDIINRDDSELHRLFFSHQDDYSK